MAATAEKTKSRKQVETKQAAPIDLKTYSANIEKRAIQTIARIAQGESPELEEHKAALRDVQFPLGLLPVAVEFVGKRCAAKRQHDSARDSTSEIQELESQVRELDSAAEEERKRNEAAMKKISDERQPLSDRASSLMLQQGHDQQAGLGILRETSDPKLKAELSVLNDAAGRLMTYFNQAKARCVFDPGAKEGRQKEIETLRVKSAQQNFEAIRSQLENVRKRQAEINVMILDPLGVSLQYILKKCAG